jgi:4-aminobutyrate aminotransferase-like enzyme
LFKKCVDKKWSYWYINSRDNPRNELNGERSKMNSSKINQKNKEYLPPYIANYYSTPLCIKKREGLYVYDWEDNKYLD